MDETNSRQPSDESWYDADLLPEEVRRLSYRAVDMITDYLKEVRDVPVFPARVPAQIEAVFREALPSEGQDPDRILDDWTEKVLPDATHLGSPRYFGFVNGSGSIMGILADTLAASINMNVGGWKASPATTEIERQIIAWLAELIGYAPDCGGLITSGGQMANFTALYTALRSTVDSDIRSKGLHGAEPGGRFRIYMADHEGHVSILRVADLVNLGEEAVGRVPSRDDYTMNPGALATMIEQDRRRGDIPFCVVAQVGSINVGAIDPLEEIAATCEEHGLWFHADGACGAVGTMLSEKQALYKGLEQADSITLDPHKWLHAPYECGCVLVREADKLRHAFSMTADYLQGTLRTEYEGLNYFDYGPQMSRGFKALKVWMRLKHYGVEGYRRLLAQNIRCAEHLDTLVRSSPEFEALHRPTLNIYSFRYCPEEYRVLAGQSEVAREVVDTRLDRINQRIADEVQTSSEAFFMTSKLRGRRVLRLSICFHRTTLADIEQVFDTIRTVVARIDEENPSVEDEVAASLPDDTP